MATLARRARHSSNTWPGFVDALASLLMVIIFLLMIFVLAQFFLSQALSGRDQAIRQLESRIGELADLLQMERSSNEDLRDNLAQLSQELRASVRDRDALNERVRELQADNAKAETALSQAFESLMSEQERRAALQQQLAALRDQRATLAEEKAALESRASSLEEEKTALERRASGLEEEKTSLAAQSEAQQARIESLLADIQALQALKADLEDKVFELAGQLEDARARAERAETDLSEAAEALDDKQRRIIVLEQNLESRERQVEETEDLLIAERDVSESAQAKVAQLNHQLRALREQLATLSAQLDQAEQTAKEQEVEIQSLGKRLNAALATKVQELSRYRSEFFGRLREILGERDNIRVVGDRFVFQSEVLFDKGEAQLEEPGKDELRHLAGALKDILAKIPDDIDWVLRVDGHTDTDPIATARFPSNWELSAARAIEVVNFLIDQGIPPRRLVAAGFGEYNPIAEGATEAAKRRNRRIEFKLTQR